MFRLKSMNFREKNSKSKDRVPAVALNPRHVPSLASALTDTVRDKCAFHSDFSPYKACFGSFLLLKIRVLFKFLTRCFKKAF